jgi:hypothetical protein
MGKCFVIAPFKEPFNRYYHEIWKKVIRKAGYKPVRGDEKEGASDLIIDTTVAAIREAEFCVADITGLNVNVLYELGIAHSLGKPVIQMVQNVKELPFDIGHRRHIVYDPNIAKWDEDLSERLKRNIAALAKDVVEQRERAARREDFVAFFGAHSLEKEYKAVFFDGQLPRLKDFVSYSRIPCARDIFGVANLKLPRERRDLCVVRLDRKPRKMEKEDPCALPKGIRQIIPLKEFVEVMKLDREFRDLGGKGIIVEEDNFREGSPDLPTNGCLSTGLGFNNLTVMLGDLSGAYEVVYKHRTDNFCRFKDRSAKPIWPRATSGHEYALIARVLLPGRDHKLIPYLVCAGHTADGTASACGYLADNWRDIWYRHCRERQEENMAVVMTHSIINPFRCQELGEPAYTPVRGR